MLFLSKEICHHNIGLNTGLEVRHLLRTLGVSCVNNHFTVEEYEEDVKKP
jgi:hypothetical protein